MNEQAKQLVVFGPPVFPIREAPRDFIWVPCPRPMCWGSGRFDGESKDWEGLELFYCGACRRSFYVARI